MDLSDLRWRFVVEELLGARAERCEALVARIAARHPEAARAEALARSFLPRAIVTGAPSALADALPRALVLALIEQRATLRRAAMLRACLWRLDDPRYFERAGWAREALLTDRPALDLAARTSARFAVRLGVLRGTHGATRWLGRRVSRAARLTAASVFDVLEHRRLSERALAQREARLRPARPAKVIRLLVRPSGGADDDVRDDGRTMKP